MILDQFGKPVTVSKLRHEEATASIRSIRQPLSQYPSRNLTPQRLASIMQAADQGDPHAQCELFEDIEEKDCHILSVLGTRRRAVSGLKIRVEAPNGADKQEQKATDLLREHLANIPSMSEHLFNILDAVGKGYSVSELIWQIHKQEAIVSNIKWREPKHFQFDRDTLSELRLRDASHDGKQLTPYKYIVHTHRAKSGLTVRGGILRTCAWMYLFKNMTLKDWVIFAEVYGQPLRVGKYQSSASQDEKDILLQAVSNLGSDAAAIIPEGMLIEFIESAKNGSADLYEGLAKYCDAQTSKAILGQTMTADASSTGLGSNQADVQNEVRHDLRDADALQLSETLTQQLARPIVDLNIGQLSRYPRIVIAAEKKRDKKELSASIKAVYDMGLPVPAQFVYQQFDIPEPEKNETVLQISPPKAVNALAKNNKDDAEQFVVDLMADKLSDAHKDMMQDVQNIVTQAEDMQQLETALLSAYGNLASDDLANVMTIGFAAAHLGGMSDVDDDGLA